MNDTKLIQSIKNNDENAIAELMSRYSKLLWKLADDILCQIGSAADIEEIVADVFIYIWQNPDSFDKDRSSLKNYLCIICRSKSIDKFRQLSRKSATDIDSLELSNALDLESQIINQEDIQHLYNAIALLPEDEQDIFVRRFLYEQKPKEISKALSKDIRQVENIIYRSKTKICNALNQRG